MGFKIILFSRFLSLLSFIYIIINVKDDKLNEKESLFWVIGCLFIFIITIFPKILDRFSYWIGIQYPPSTLLLFSTIIVYVLLFRHYKAISD